MGLSSCNAEEIESFSVLPASRRKQGRRWVVVSWQIRVHFSDLSKGKKGCFQAYDRQLLVKSGTCPRPRVAAITGQLSGAGNGQNTEKETRIDRRDDNQIPFLLNPARMHK